MKNHESFIKKKKTDVIPFAQMLCKEGKVTANPFILIIVLSLHAFSEKDKQLVTMRSVRGDMLR